MDGHYWCHQEAARIDVEVEKAYGRLILQQTITAATASYDWPLCGVLVWFSARHKHDQAVY